MDDFRKEVIKELEEKLGDGYEILPYNRVRNNKIVLHGVCIHNKDKTVCPVMYLDEYILPYAAGAMNPEEIAGKLLEEYFEDGIPQDIVEHVGDFSLMKDKVRVKVINYDANTKKLEQIPHRKFLDLAIAYYLDMEVKLREGNMTIGITDELMEKWGVSEEELYRLGMENLSAKDSFSASELIGIIRKMAQTGLDERSEKLLEEIEKEDGPDAELYVASNRKHLFGACCMLAEDFLQELAERTESSLLIYPVNTMEVMIYPLEKGNKNHMDTKDMQRINRNSDPGEECLSNSIYLYDKTRQEISVYKKGEPL